MAKMCRFGKYEGRTKHNSQNLDKNTLSLFTLCRDDKKQTRATIDDIYSIRSLLTAT